MLQDTESALVILKRAMAIEREGHGFYLKAAQTTEDEKGRETFTTLAEDERKHLELINRQYKALRGEGRWVRSAEAKPVDADLSKPLFPKWRGALGKTITARSGDRGALLFGLDIETKSYDLYRNAALRTGDPLGKAMFEFLAGEERSHFDTLMMRYDFLFGPIAWSA